MKHTIIAAVLGLLTFTTEAGACPTVVPVTLINLPANTAVLVERVINGTKYREQVTSDAQGRTKVTAFKDADILSGALSGFMFTVNKKPSDYHRQIALIHVLRSKGRCPGPIAVSPLK